MATKRRSKFKGILARPFRMPEKPKNALMMDEWRVECDRFITKEYVKRLNALLSHYEIKQGERDVDAVLLDLVYCLAEEFVPGFRVATNRTGRRLKWTSTEQIQLLFFVRRELDRSRKSSRLTARSACFRLVKDGRPYDRYGGETLYRLYQKAKKANPRWEEFTELRECWDKTGHKLFRPEN